MSIDVDRPYPLSTEQVENFGRDGFVKLRDVFSSDELQYYGGEIARLTVELNTQTRPMEERSTYDKAFLQVVNLWRHGDRTREFVFGKRLAAIAAALLEVEGVRLYHDQALYKEPGGGITPAHADQYYWPLSSDRTVTAWIPMQSVSQEMGPLAFFAGSRSMEFGRNLRISDESEAMISQAVRDHGFSIVDEPFELGEVSFHLGWTFHRAGPNRTSRPRSVMTIIYMDRDMRLTEPANEPQQMDKECFCSGVAVGDVIDGPLTPVLFERVA
jgi:ectoine hydroxylase-related dioxygenase (phytanoyl-CoA dioxygenase family)